MRIRFDFDPKKKRINPRLHGGVTFEEAETVFILDPLLITIFDDAHSDADLRYTTIGYSEKNRLLRITHNENGSEKGDIIIRIISVRLANARDLERYETGEL